MECIIKKICHCVKQNVPLVNVMELEVFILGGQRIDQKRKKRGRRERIERGSERDREKRDKRELS